MSPFADGAPRDPEFDAFGDVLEWLPHPDEPGRRACHAIPGDAGLWLVDPIDVPGLDEHLADLEAEVAGALVCSNAHARDAGSIAERHDVSVHVPPPLDRAAARVDGPLERTPADEIDPAIEVRLVRPLPRWHEAILRFEGGVYVPEQLGSAPTHTVAGERIGAHVFARPVLSTDALADLEPERVFLGHGRAVTDDAAAALTDVVEHGRRRFPRALAAHGPEQAVSILRNVVLD